MAVAVGFSLQFGFHTNQNLYYPLCKNHSISLFVLYMTQNHLIPFARMIYYSHFGPLIAPNRNGSLDFEI